MFQFLRVIFLTFQLIINTLAAPTIPLGTDWTVNVTIGTPPVIFNLVLDFGINYAWMFGWNCTIPRDCQEGRNTYNPAQSSTAKPNGTELTYRYAGGEITIRGHYQEDSFTILGQPSIKNVIQFASVEQEIEPRFFPPTKIDGPLGLAYPTKDYQNLSIILNLYNANLIPEPIYSIWANQTNGQLMLGEINKSAYLGAVGWTPILLSPFSRFYKNELFLMTSKIDDVLVNGISTNYCNQIECLFMVDTAGGPGILGKTVPPLNVSSNCSNINTLPTYTFIINNNKFDFTPEDYIIESINSITGEIECTLGFETTSVDTPLLFGWTWLRAYYTIFDIGNNMIGFARAVDNLG